MRGGDGAAENALKVAGNGNQQWDNVFKGDGNTSNALVPLNKAGGSRRRKRGGGAPVAPTHHHGSSGPDVPPTTKTPSGGSRRRRGKKGGFWGEIINRAIVPFGILGLQQTYRRRKSGGTKRRRH